MACKMPSKRIHMNMIDQLHRDGRSLEATYLEDYETLLGNSDRSPAQEVELRRLESLVNQIMKSFQKRPRKR